jgi:hypothetical protein
MIIETENGDLDSMFREGMRYLYNERPRDPDDDDEDEEEEMTE